MFKEILELAEYCKTIGVESELSILFDGYVLRFKNGGDAAQHFGTYGSLDGCVEFGYTGFSKTDFVPTPLKKAKAFVKRNKDKLNKGIKI